MKLTFYGGAKSVTGSNYLIESGETKIIVDCGLFQGSKYAEELNYSPFEYNPAEIDYVLITHSHADHVGRFPKLYKDGFRGRAYTTSATLEMIRCALPDNAGLIKEEAIRDNHDPLFSEEDMNAILGITTGVNYQEPVTLGDFKVTFFDAGHILGAAIIKLEAEGKSIYFSGDLGNPPTPLLNYPYMPKDGDYAIMESAYGNRIHEDRGQRREILIDAIIQTIKRGGTVIIPSFAIERTQEMLYEFNQAFNDKEIPKVPIFVDSPLAIKLTQVYKQFPEYFNAKTNYIINSGDDIFDFPGLQFTETSAESKKINDVVGPKIIIAGSGMSNGGRVLFHEKRYLPDPASLILFVGYQVDGTLGRKILDGEKFVRIIGDTVPVNCQILAIGGYSAHADQNMLTEWAKGVANGGQLKKLFVVQGEEDSATSLAQRIKTETGVETIVPGASQSFEL
jgi:metallo-beta-lactamase family protein